MYRCFSVLGKLLVTGGTEEVGDVIDAIRSPRTSGRVVLSD